MEILRRARRLAHLNVVFGGDLQEALDTRAGMLRSLTFEAMGKQKHYARRQVPFVLARANELVDDHLGSVGEISELRFPQHQRLGALVERAAHRVLPAEPYRSAFKEERAKRQ